MMNGVPGRLSNRAQASQTIGRQPMNHYAAIDLSLELSSVCIVDATGKVLQEAKAETRPEALAKFFKDFGLPLTRIGLEAGPLSQGQKERERWTAFWIDAQALPIRRNGRNRRDHRGRR